MCHTVKKTLRFYVAVLIFSLQTFHLPRTIKQYFIR